MYVTGLARTLPRLARAPAPRLRVIETGPTSLLGSGGAAARELPPGAIVHDGPATIAAASTVPSYGRGVVLFPYTERDPARFQLRIAHVGAVDALRGLVAILRGRRDGLPGVIDVATAGVTIEALDPCPAHLAGEVWWPARPFAVTLAPRVIPVLRSP
jgi:diacylglycerol kinase family enzyme